MYILQSKIDGQIFNVDKKVIDASVLLKNIAEFTEITEPIILDCSSQCLEIFIKLITHYEAIKNHRISKYISRFDRKLFNDFDDVMIAELVKEVAYLDSDVFIDVADIILDRMQTMNFKKMQDYLGLEDDFTAEERELIKKNQLEYLIGINKEQLQFPFPNTNFLTLKSKFSSPMNAVLARIIKRSNGRLAYRLSMINKTLKNEINRHPIKVSTFHGGYDWSLDVGSNNFVLKEYDDVKMYNAIKKRKVIPYHQASMRYDYHKTTIHSSSLDFVIPEKVPTLGYFLLIKDFAKIYILQSKTDGQSFQVDLKVIDASVLLKNLAEFTEITEPIVLDCSSQCLEIFIKLIQHYDDITNYHFSKFEKELFKDFTDEMVAEIVKETTYLDSDIFIDVVADVVLDRIKNFSYKEMQEYFGLEDDFTAEERELIKNNQLEYLIGIDKEQLQFPFPNTNFLSLQNKFWSPMNAFLARVIQRSNEDIAFKLSMVNKTLKNENDRHPIKVSDFSGGNYWVIFVERTKFDLNKEGVAKFFDRVKSRKLLPYNNINMHFVYNSSTKTAHCTSLDYVIPENVSIARIWFSQNRNQIYNFDIQHCPFPEIVYILTQITVDFDEFYQQLIAKDLSKDIRIDSWSAFDFIPGEFIHFLKKPDASKFYEIFIRGSRNKTVLPKFKTFIMNYMEDDGIIRAYCDIFQIQNGCKKLNNEYVYKVATVKEYLRNV